VLDQCKTFERLRMDLLTLLRIALVNEVAAMVFHQSYVTQ